MATKTTSSRQRQFFVDEPFWRRYSPHYEFPLSSVGSFCLHVLIGGLLFLIGMLGLFGWHDDSGQMPIDAVVIAGGGGNPLGVGGGPGVGEIGGNEALDELPPDSAEPLTVGAPTREQLKEARKAALDVPEFQNEDAKHLIQKGGQAVDNLIRLNKDLRDKLTKGIVAGKGEGGPGRGGGKGGGVGIGEGDDAGPGKSTGNIRSKRLQRVLRWTMLFNTRDGQDYARQLAGLGAILAVPDPEHPERHLVIRDLLARPVQPKEEDLAQIKRIFWTDDKASSVMSLAGALGLHPAPSHIVAFFPEELELKLLKMELGYRHRKEEEIEETRFEIRSSFSGTYEPMVISQRP